MQLKNRRLSLIISLLCVLMIGVDAFPEEPVVGVHVAEKAVDFTLPVVGTNGDEEVNLYEQVEKYDVVLLYFFFAAT